MNDIPANLLYSPEELEKWLDDPYDNLPLGMIDEEFFEEIALKQREPTDDELCDMFNLSAEEHPEWFDKI